MKHITASTIIVLAALLTAAPSLGWDTGDSLWKQPEQQQRERNSWDRQQETYAKQNYDTYQYGPAVRHEEEMRRHGQALTNMDRANQWQRERQQEQQQRSRR